MRLFLILAALALSACTPPAPQTAASTAVDPNAITVTAPVVNTASRSPLRVTGVAPNFWYFEALFDARLEGPGGVVLAEAPAQAQSDWTTEGPVAFVAEFTFTVKEDTPAVVVLTRYRGDPEAAQPGDVVRIPVILQP